MCSLHGSSMDGENTYEIIDIEFGPSMPMNELLRGLHEITDLPHKIWEIPYSNLTIDANTNFRGIVANSRDEHVFIVHAPPKSPLLDEMFTMAVETWSRCKINSNHWLGHIMYMNDE